jgi:hypothetical protein
VPNLGDTYAMHPLVRWVRSLPEDYFLPMEVAEQLDIAPSMLHYWATAHPGLSLGPSHHARYQDITISLYTTERVEHIRAFLDSHHAIHPTRGAARLFSAAESQRRRRVRNRIKDLHKRAPGFAARGMEEKAAQMLHDAGAMRVMLDQEKAQRIKELKQAGGGNSANAPIADSLTSDEA